MANDLLATSTAVVPCAGEERGAEPLVASVDMEQAYAHERLPLIVQ